MTASTKLNPRQLGLLHGFVDHLSTVNADAQERMLKNNTLLREHDGALQWFLDNVNDSWRINPGALYEYIRMWAPRIVFIDYFPFMNHTPITDGTQFVALASLTQAWEDNGYRDDARERKILREYNTYHLPRQFRQLLHRGAIGRDITHAAPVTVKDTGLSIQLYTAETISDLYAIYTAHGPGYPSVEANLKNLAATHAEHFLLYWLAHLLPATEYQAIKDINLSILRELYPHIWHGGPSLLRAAYLNKVTAQVTHEHVAVNQVMTDA